MSAHHLCKTNCGGTDCDAPRTTITAAHGHSMKPGDLVCFEQRDLRWWRRALFWLLRLGEPRRTITRRVSQASNTTLML